LVDVTCDSDGKIDKFVDLKDVKETLELPEWRENEDYYVGLFLVGAYQEVMGSFHNLFGLPNEAQVFLVDDGQFHVSKLIAGSHIEDMVRFAQYDTSSLQQAFAKKVNHQVLLGVLKQVECDQMIQEYVDAARWSTYLE
jgi:arginine decarboxylase